LPAQTTGSFGEVRGRRLFQHDGAVHIGDGTSISIMEGQRRRWCLDSGATTHLCDDASSFREINSSRSGILNLANCTSTKTKGEGTAQLAANVSGGETSISLSKTLLVPDLRTNLLSVSKIVDRNFEVLFRKESAVVLDSRGEVKMRADRVGDLFFARESRLASCAASTVPKSEAITLELLHRRMGHTNVRDIRDAVHKGIMSGIKELSCDVCAKGKMSRSPFPKSSGRNTGILELVHTDVCGPMRTESIEGARYFVEFIDCTGWCEVRFLKSKAEVFKATTDYIALVERQKGKPVKSLQSDNGRKYVNREFDEYLRRRGVTRRLTVPHTPEQNGTAESRNRTLLDATRCLLLDSGLPTTFWVEAVNTSNYVRNRMPTKKLKGRTPFEAWTGKVPNVEHLRVFGCRVIFRDRKIGKGKLESRGEEGIFLGYLEESKAYRIWSPLQRRVLVSRDVKFFDEAGAQGDRHERR